MKVLGIDYSLNGTGLAVYDGKEIIMKKVFTTTKKDEENNPEIFIYVPKMSNAMEKTVYIIGHKNPDTDAVVSAVGYARLKNLLGFQIHRKVFDKI